jgi:hypothetical protein
MKITKMATLPTTYKINNKSSKKIKIIKLLDGFI